MLAGTPTVAQAKAWKKAGEGFSLGPYARQIGRLAFETGSKSILDYGAGDFDRYRVEGVDRVWGIIPVLYNIHKEAKYARNLENPVDGVICCDVLHRLTIDQVDKAMHHIARLAQKWVFLVVRCSPGPGVAMVRPEQWWHERMLRFIGGRPVRIVVVCPS